MVRLRWPHGTVNKEGGTAFFFFNYRVWATRASDSVPRGQEGLVDFLGAARLIVPLRIHVANQNSTKA